MTELFVLRTVTLAAFQIGRIPDKNYLTVWDLRFGMSNKKFFALTVCFGACRCYTEGLYSCMCDFE